MPIKTRSLHMKRNRKNLTRSKKANNKNKRVWICKMDNITLCYRAPNMKIKTIPSIEYTGGASSIEANVNKLLFEQLPGGTTDKNIQSFLSKKDTKLVKDLIKSGSQPALASVLEELKNPEPNILGKSGLTVAGNALLEWVKKRQMASTIIDSIKEKAKSTVSAKELETIERTLNNENVCEAPGASGAAPGAAGVAGLLSQGLSSVSSKAFSGVKDGAVSLGSFIAPATPLDMNRRRQNDTTIQMLWYPRSNIHYKKGNSQAIPKDKIKYGDFMIYVEPERYADVSAYFSETSNSVEDLFANILNGCSDSFCLKGEPLPSPYKHQALQINNYQPDFDDKEMQKSSISRG